MSGLLAVRLLSATSNASSDSLRSQKREAQCKLLPRCVRVREADDMMQFTYTEIVLHARESQLAGEVLGGNSAALVEILGDVRQQCRRCFPDEAVDVKRAPRAHFFGSRRNDMLAQTSDIAQTTAVVGIVRGAQHDDLVITAIPCRVQRRRILVVVERRQLSSHDRSGDPRRPVEHNFSMIDC